MLSLVSANGDLTQLQLQFSQEGNLQSAGQESAGQHWEVVCGEAPAIPERKVTFQVPTSSSAWHHLLAPAPLCLSQTLTPYSPSELPSLC